MCELRRTQPHSSREREDTSAGMAEAMSDYMHKIRPPSRRVIMACPLYLAVFITLEISGGDFVVEEKFRENIITFLGCL